MKRLVIAVDCDDIIVESASAILKNYHETHGVEVPAAEMYSTDPRVWGVEHQDEAIARVYAYLRSEEHAMIPPVKEAVEALRALSKRHEIHLVTGRADFLKEATLAWIDEHFPGVFTSTEFTNFIVPTSHQHVTRSKADVARQLAADVFIEDHPHHARIVADAGVQVLLYDWPWNRSIGAGVANVTRVRDWREIVDRIDLMDT
jgi:uncharacterized HAD superfamily protein